MSVTFCAHFESKVTTTSVESKHTADAQLPLTFWTFGEHIADAYLPLTSLIFCVMAVSLIAD